MSTYSETETKRLIDAYIKEPTLDTVDRLSVQLNRTRKSIIAKLSKEGVYITRGYTDYRGEKPVTKLELVHQIEDALDLQLPGLDKSPKETLRKLAQATQDLASQFEDALEEIADLTENQRIQQDMNNVKRSRQNDDPLAVLLEGQLENL